MEWITDILLSFLISFGITIFVIPRILLISFKKKLFDMPDERKIHEGIIPRLGGVSFFPSILFSLSFVIASHYLYSGYIPENITKLFPELLLIMCCLIMFYLVGVADDLIGVRYHQKFLVQIFCGILLTTSGLWINNFHGLFGIHEISPYIGVPFTIFIVVFIINAVNLIDGIDGLASGLSSIALFIFGLLFIYQRQGVYAMVAFSTLGVLIPFFYYNVFGKAERQSKIFMGDTGSLTIGMILSFLTVRFSMYDVHAVHSLDGSIVIAFSLLIIPMFDVIRVMIRRFRTGKHIFKPDKNHIHHKFLSMGFTPRRAMVTILCISGLFAAGNILLHSYINITLLLFLDIAVWIGMHVWMNRRVKLYKELNDSTDDMIVNEEASTYENL